MIFFSLNLLAYLAMRWVLKRDLNCKSNAYKICMGFHVDDVPNKFPIKCILFGIIDIKEYGFGLEIASFLCSFIEMTYDQRSMGDNPAHRLMMQ